MPTMLLLLQDVEDLGKKGEVVKVKPGFARNYLIPQEFGVIADKKALRLQARLQEERKKQAIIDKQEADATASKLSAVTLTTIVKVDQEGHMFGSVSALDIVKMLKEQHQIELARKAVILIHPIKKTGSYAIGIRLKEGVESTIKLNVEPDIQIVQAPSEIVKPIPVEGEEAPQEEKPKKRTRKAKAETSEEASEE